MSEDGPEEEQVLHDGMTSQGASHGASVLLPILPVLPFDSIVVVQENEDVLGVELDVVRVNLDERIPGEQ